MLLAVAELGDARGTWLGGVVRGDPLGGGPPAALLGPRRRSRFVTMVVRAGAERPRRRPSASGATGRVQSFLQVAIGALLLAPLALRTVHGAVPVEPCRSPRSAAASFGFFLWHIQVLRGVRPLLDGGRAGGRRSGLALRGRASRSWPARRSRRYVEAPGPPAPHPLTGALGALWWSGPASIR